MAKFDISYSSTLPIGQGPNVRAHMDTDTGAGMLGNAIHDFGGALFDVGLKVKAAQDFVHDSEAQNQMTTLGDAYIETIKSTPDAAARQIAFEKAQSDIQGLATNRRTKLAAAEYMTKLRGSSLRIGNEIDIREAKDRSEILLGNAIAAGNADSATAILDGQADTMLKTRAEVDDQKARLPNTIAMRGLISSFDKNDFAAARAKIAAVNADTLNPEELRAYHSVVNGIGAAEEHAVEKQRAEQVEYRIGVTNAVSQTLSNAEKVNTEAAWGQAEKDGLAMIDKSALSPDDKLDAKDKLKKYTSGVGTVDYDRLRSLQQRVNDRIMSDSPDPTLESDMAQAFSEGAYGSRKSRGGMTYDSEVKRLKSGVSGKNLSATKDVVAAFERDQKFAQKPGPLITRSVFLLEQKIAEGMAKHPEWTRKEAFMFANEKRDDMTAILKGATAKSLNEQIMGGPKGFRPEEHVPENLPGALLMNYEIDQRNQSGGFSSSLPGLFRPRTKAEFDALQAGTVYLRMDDTWARK